MTEQLREYTPFILAVLVTLAGWMIAAAFAPTTAVMAAGLIVASGAGFTAGVLAAWRLWGREQPAEPVLDMVAWHGPEANGDKDTGFLYDTTTGKTMIDGKSIEEWARTKVKR